jgi:signal transduction histidine kinase
MYDPGRPNVSTLIPFPAWAPSSGLEPRRNRTARSRIPRRWVESLCPSPRLDQGIFVIEWNQHVESIPRNAHVKRHNEALASKMKWSLVELPLWAVAMAALLSGLVPPGPIGWVDFWISAGLLASLTLLAALARRRLDRFTYLVGATLYIASVVYLTLSSGGSSGFGALFLIPVVAVALRLGRWDSFIVVLAVVGGLAWVALDQHASGAVTVRRLLLWGAMGMAVSVAIVGLREQLQSQAAASERRRIARELHDGLAHELAFITSKTRRWAHNGSSHGINGEIARAADRALDEARRAITILSSEQPELLSRSIEQTAEDLGARLRLAVRVEIAEEIDVAPDVAENLLRIVREAITNTARHSGAQQVTVRLWKDTALHLVIADEGNGFGPGRPASKGFGLMSMEERAVTIGGRFAVRSAPSFGTEIEVILP